MDGVEEQRSATLPGARQFLEEKLKLQQNPLMAEYLGLRDRVLDLFEENFAAVSMGDFDYGHATAVQCHIQLKAGEEEPVRLKAWPLNPAQEASMKVQLKE